MKKTTQATHIRLSRKALSRREKERRLKQYLIIGTAVLVGVIVIILGWGLYDQYVLRPRRPVALVAGEPIRLDAYQKLVKYRSWDYRNYVRRLAAQRQELAMSDQDQSFLIQYIDQQISQVENQIANLPYSVLDEMIDDELARQEAARRGITVTEDEVQARLEEQFGYDPNPPTPVPITSTAPITVTPTPTVAPMTYEEFTEQSTAWFGAVAGATGFGREDFERLLETVLYREKLEEAIKSEVQTTAEQVHARHILLETQEEAEEALRRLRDGEDFGDLAAELSTDTSNKDEGGDLGWFAHGQMVSEFEDATFALQPGEMSDVVETQFGFHLIRVEEREENRELEPSTLAVAQQKAVGDWYDQQRISEEVVHKWDPNMIPEDTY